MRCEFLGVNVRFLAREDGCPPPAFSCSPSKKATLNDQIYVPPRLVESRLFSVLTSVRSVGAGEREMNYCSSSCIELSHAQGARQFIAS